MIDTIQYVVLQSHVSGPNNLWNTHLWESYGTYATGPIYDPIHYFYKYKRALVFYKTMLIKRQRVLLVSSIESHLRISGPFSHLFLTSAWIGGALTNYRKVQKKLRYFGVLLDVLYYLESTHQKFILKGLTQTTQNQIIYILPKFRISPQDHLIMPRIFNLSNNINYHFSIKYVFNKQLNYRLNYLKIYAGLTNIKVGAQFLFLELFLITHIFRLSFILNAKQITTIDEDLELNYQFYLNPIKFSGEFILNLIYRNIFNLILKNVNFLKFIKCFYKKPGNPYLRLRRIFPAVNVALDLRLANMYILNESSRLYLPLISFHKSDDPARGPVYTIPAHIATKNQTIAFGFLFLGLVLKTQIMDLQQLFLWNKFLSWRN